MQIPDVLTSYKKEIEKALHTPVLAAWPEDETYAEAPQPRQLAEVLLPVLHAHLAGARIAYLFREKLTRRGQVGLGKAAKASAQLAYLADFDFVITFNWTAWRELRPEQRLALVDHELCHCDKDEESWVLKYHDVEDFTAVVRRWGLWTPDLRSMGEAMQLSLELIGSHAD